MLVSLNDASGRVTKTYIRAGEPLQQYMLFPGRDGLSANLETHERAITLQLEDDALIDHSIQPDDRVDLLVVSSNQNKKYTKTICQDVRVVMTAPKEQVLAHSINTPTNKITLAVQPDQAELITEAIEAGKVRLALRSHLSRTEQHLLGANSDDLLPVPAQTTPKSTISEKTAVLPPPPPPETVTDEQEKNPLLWTVEMIMGNKKETYAVPEK
jgi:Flp pilus assembly protein CpaB